jgi:hypothetical protein
LVAAILAGCAGIVGIPEGRHLASEDGSDGAEASLADSRTPPADVTTPDVEPRDAGVTTFCQGMPSPVANRVFCDDFEEGGASLSQWSTFMGVSIDPSEFSPPPSPGHSLRIDVPEDAGAACPASASVNRSFTPSGTFELAFDLYRDNFGGVNVAIVLIAGPGANLALLSNDFDGDPLIQEYVNGSTVTNKVLSSASWASSGWIHIDMVLTPVSGAASNVQLTVGNDPPVNVTLSSNWNLGDELTLTLQSCPQADPGADTRLHIDNVQVGGS